MKNHGVVFRSCGSGFYALDKEKLFYNHHEKIAYISNSGKIEFSKSVYSISGPVLLKIEHFADTVAANYRG